MSNCVLILGAGTMGAGIAQVAATHGWNVLLRDVDVATAQRGVEGIHSQLDALVQKGKITSEERDAALVRLQPCDAGDDLSHADVLIEAIVENIDIKARVLRELLPRLGSNCIIATNTSSLSVSAIGSSIDAADRTVGMHFFNPAPGMKLVEVVAGKSTQPGILDRVAAIAQSWGKVVARCADVPGFIVNHVARPYYLEAFRILEDGYADALQIDEAIKSVGGFRMGPLELTDLIGQDVNTATSRSVWEQLGKPPLLKPSALQESLVAEGNLGRKTGCGVYHYIDGKANAALMTDRRAIPWNDALTQALHDFVRAVNESATERTQQYVFARIHVAIIAQAHHALKRGVASATDIDTAMKFGVNYPRGPFEWTRQIGPQNVVALLKALNASVRDDRFATPSSL